MSVWIIILFCPAVPICPQPLSRRFLRERRCLNLGCVIFALLLFLTPGTINASSLELSLREAFRLLLEQNPQLEATRAQRDVAEGLERQTLQGFLPTISFDTTYLRLDSSYLDDVAVPVIAETPPPGLPQLMGFAIQDLGPYEAYSSGLLLVQPLVNLETWRARRQAIKQVNAADFAIEQSERELALNLIEAYYGVIVAGERLMVEKSAVLSAERTLRLVESSFEEGLVAQVEIFRARTQLFEFRARVSEAEGALAVAWAQLRQILGFDEDVEITLKDDIPDPVKIFPDNGLTQLNIENRKDIRAQQAAVSAAEVGVGRARAAYLPRVNLLGRYQWIDQSTFLGDDDQLWMVAVNLQWTIFAGMSRSGDIARAHGQEREQRARLQTLRQGALAEARSNEALWQSAVASWEHTKEAAINAAAALEQTRGMYMEGLEGITELLRAQTEDLRAKTMQVNARFEAVVAAHRYRLSALAEHPMGNWP